MACLLLVLSAVLLMPAGQVPAQATPPVSAELRYAYEGDKGVITGWCVNPGRKPWKLSYQLYVKGPDGTLGPGEEYREKGQFVIAAYAAPVITEYVFQAGPTDSPTARLRIFLDSSRLAEAHLPEPILGTDSADPGYGGTNTDESPPGEMTDNWSFLLDRTKTIAGQHFFYLFQSRWETMAPRGAFTLTVEEMPLRGRTTRIRLLFNEEEFFTRVLQPKPDYLESLADYAIGYSLQRVEQEHQLLRDLKKEDLSGTGVF